MKKNGIAQCLKFIGAVFIVLGVIAALGVYNEVRSAGLFVLVILVGGFLSGILFISFGEVIALLQEKTNAEHEILKQINVITDCQKRIFIEIGALEASNQVDDTSANRNLVVQNDENPKKDNAKKDPIYNHGILAFKRIDDGIEEYWLIDPETSVICNFVYGSDNDFCNQWKINGFGSLMHKIEFTVINDESEETWMLRFKNRNNPNVIAVYSADDLIGEFSATDVNTAIDKMLEIEEKENSQ